MSTADELRQILKEDRSGKNLYNHLTETLMKLLIEKPTNAYDQVGSKWLEFSRNHFVIWSIITLDHPLKKMIDSQFELMSADVKLNPFNPDPEVGRAIIKSEEEVGSSFTRLVLFIAAKELRKRH